MGLGRHGKTGLRALRGAGRRLRSVDRCGDGSKGPRASDRCSRDIANRRRATWTASVPTPLVDATRGVGTTDDSLGVTVEQTVKPA